MYQFTSLLNERKDYPNWHSECNKHNVAGELIKRINNEIEWNNKAVNIINNLCSVNIGQNGQLCISFEACPTIKDSFEFTIKFDRANAEIDAVRDFREGKRNRFPCGPSQRQLTMFETQFDIRMNHLLQNSIEIRLTKNQEIVDNGQRRNAMAGETFQGIRVVNNLRLQF